MSPAWREISSFSPSRKSNFLGLTRWIFCWDLVELYFLVSIFFYVRKKTGGCMHRKVSSSELGIKISWDILVITKSMHVYLESTYYMAQCYYILPNKQAACVHISQEWVCMHSACDKASNKPHLLKTLMLCLDPYRQTHEEDYWAQKLCCLLMEGWWWCTDKRIHEWSQLCVLSAI